MAREGTSGWENEVDQAWLRLVARAWADENLKKQLLTNPEAVLKQNGFSVLPEAMLIKQFN